MVAPRESGRLEYGLHLCDQAPGPLWWALKVQRGIRIEVQPEHAVEIQCSVPPSPRQPESGKAQSTTVTEWFSGLFGTSARATSGPGLSFNFSVNGFSPKNLHCDVVSLASQNLKNRNQVET